MVMQNTTHLNTNFREFNNLDCSTNGQCLKYIAEFKHMKDKEKDKVSRALVLKETEAKFLEDFLNENNIKFGTLAMILLYRDGAMSNELISSYRQSVKKSTHQFLFIDDFSFNYKNHYENIDWNEIFANDKNKLKNFNIKFVLDKYIKEYYLAKGFVSFTQYIKALFDNLGIYPDGAYEAIKKYIRTDFVINPDEKHLRDLKSDKKRQLSRRTKKVLTEDDSKQYYPVSFTVKAFEKTEIVDPFISYLKDNKLSLSILTRYELVKNNLINIEEANIGKEDIKKIQQLDYHPTINGASKLWYENNLRDSQRRATSIVFVPNNTELIKKLKGSFGTWIRHFVLKKYAAYPVINKVNVADAFINYNKISTFIKNDT